MRTPEFRKASSRSRCSSVAKSNSVLVKTVGRGQESHLGAALALGRIADQLEILLGVAVAEAHEVFLAAAPDVQVEMLAERIDHGSAHTVQAARDLVGVLVEFSAGMELGEDHVGGGNALFLVDVDRHAAAVVAHRDRTVAMQDHVDAVAIARQRLVDRIVDDLVDHVVQAGAVVGVADIHAGALAHRFEAAQHLDRIGVVVLAVAIAGGTIAIGIRSVLAHRLVPERGFSSPRSIRRPRAEPAHGRRAA